MTPGSGIFWDLDIFFRKIDFWGHFWVKNCIFQFSNPQNRLKTGFLGQKHWKNLFLWSFVAYWSHRTIQNIRKLPFCGFRVLSSYGQFLLLRVQCAISTLKLRCRPTKTSCLKITPIRHGDPIFFLAVGCAEIFFPKTRFFVFIKAVRTFLKQWIII